MNSVPGAMRLKLGLRGFSTYSAASEQVCASYRQDIVCNTDGPVFNVRYPEGRAVTSLEAGPAGAST
jgi:hypothetical protein